MLKLHGSGCCNYWDWNLPKICTRVTSTNKTVTATISKTFKVVVFQQQHHNNNKTGHLIILCCVNSPALLVQNWLTQDTQKIPRLKILRQRLKSTERDKKNQKSRDFDSMVKKAGWGDKKIKKSRLKSRDFDWMEKNEWVEKTEIPSLEILIDCEKRSY
jgi:hypothetical protein